MKNVYKNKKIQGVWFVNGGHGGHLIKKRGFKPVVTMVLAFGYKRWSGGGHKK